MAKLLETLAIAGSQKSDGLPNASGKVWVYVQGTSGQSTIYADVEGDAVLMQPVVLDAAGRAIIYITQVVTVHIETAAGVTVGDYDVADDPGVVQVQNAAFTGTLPDGSQGAGGTTDLDAILTGAGISFGGTDFEYLATTGATQRSVSQWMSEVHLSVRDFGAVGDGNTDNTAAIQAAVNRCIALNGGVVYIPPGIYKISAAIVVNSLVSVSFVGTGYSSAIVQTSAGANSFTITNSNGFQMSQLYIVANPGSTGAAVAVSRSQNFSLSDLYIDKHTTGLDLWSGTALNIYYTVARCFIAVNISAGARPIKTAGSSYASTLSDCWLHGNNTEQDLELIGNVAASYFGSGFSVRNCYMKFGILLTAVNTGSAGVISLNGNHFLVDGSVNKRITVTGTVPRISNVGNNVEGPPATIYTTSPQTYTPDWTDGRAVRIVANSAGAITINLAAPTPTPTGKGVQLHLILSNSGAGTVTWATAGVYHLSGLINGVGGNRTELTVEYDIDVAQWSEVSRSLVFV
jgi:Pectate lyase superfamily protein